MKKGPKQPQRPVTWYFVGGLSRRLKAVEAALADALVRIQELENDR